MQTVIYAFTGTGNTLAVARGVAERLGGTVLPVPQAMSEPEIALEGDAVGIASPVYHGTLPRIVRRFVDRLSGLDGRYLFGLCTYGDTAGAALEHLQTRLAERGGALAAGFAVHMPYNYLTPFLDRGPSLSFTLREITAEKRQALLAASEGRMDAIADAVRARETGHLEAYTDPLKRLGNRLGLEDSLAKRIWLRGAGIEPRPGASFWESLPEMDHGFRADENCNGCGTCVRVCPVRNISLFARRPAWRHDCEQCFACLQWCPQEAIQFGPHSAGRRRYHHPAVILADMLRQ